MAGLGFSLPYNNDDETLNGLFELKGLNGNFIDEIYLSCPQQYGGSGRVTPRINLEKFTETIKLIRTNHIRVNLIMNSTCQGAGWYSGQAMGETLEFLELMHHQHGVEAVTVANPIYIKVIRNRLPQIEICASVLSEIDSVKKAEIVTEYGANTITPDASINRDPGLLKRVKEATGVKIKLMVNEGCLYKCPFRKYHFNFVSHWSKELEQSTMDGQDFFDHCLAVSIRDYSQILKSPWVRPEDIAYYKDIASSFKLVGRTKAKSFVLRSAYAYMSQQYDGNLIDIIGSSLNAFGITYGAYIDNKSLDRHNFFQTVTSCERKCDSCDYCKNLAEKLVKLKVITRGKLEDTGQKDLADKLEAAGKLPHYA